MDNGGNNTTVTITINPQGDALIMAGNSISLTATVQGTTNTAVIWSIIPTSAENSLEKNGNQAVFTAPADAPAGRTYTIKATADANQTKSGTARIIIYDTPEEPLDTYTGINNNGDIVGTHIYSDGSARAFLDAGGSRTILEHPQAAGYTRAIGINDSQHVLGSYENSSQEIRYFLKTGSDYADLADYPGASSTDYTGINKSGQLRLVGYYKDASGVYARGFIKTGSASSSSFEPPIEHPDADPAACVISSLCGTFLTGINDLGHVVGYYRNSDGISHGFLRDDSGFTAIQPTGAGVGIHVTGINNSSEAVGYFWGSGENAHGFAFAKAGNRFEPFDHPGAAVEGKGTYFTGINDSGRITGWYDDGDKTRGFTSDFSELIP